ncbi:MAG: hypothetical protein MUF75_00705 [Bacteroidia bacterium]|jgi:uncharacterized tellurite resistance protein B-like protein|nr:hypothetical protein [Bacteroidia bacterium]
MTPIENLHYALGELAYAFAKVDGKVNPEERKKFEQIITAGFKQNNYNYDVSDIIFKILEKDKRDVETVYTWAIHELQVNSHYLSPELKECALKIMKSITEAFPPVTIEENELYQRFVKDIGPLKGDPIFYKKS